MVCLCIHADYLGLNPIIKFRSFIHIARMSNVFIIVIVNNQITVKPYNVGIVIAHGSIHGWGTTFGCLTV